ncbi:MAG: hypothetical protein JWN73_3758 [Betaproteobacteria bacterium]|nr:hypothetical protein [Betaproteobacteria bacterium]
MGEALCAVFERSRLKGKSPVERAPLQRVAILPVLFTLCAGLAWQSAAQAAVALSADFTPTTIIQGDRTRLTITIQNNGQSVLTGATLVDDLPTQIRFYPPSSPGYVAPATTCPAGTVTPVSGAIDELQFSGGQIPAAPLNGVIQCTVSVDVTSTVNVGAGNTATYTNQIAANQYSDDTPQNATSPLSNSLNVTGLAAPTVSKTFGTSPLTQGNNSTVAITLSNLSASVLGLTTFTDTLPANLTVASVTAAACSGGVVTNTAGSVTLTGGSIPANGSCAVNFVVTGVLPAATTSQNGTNTFAAGAVGNTRGLTSPAASTNIRVDSPIVLTKGFSPSPLSSGLNATFTAHIQNNSSAGLTNVGLSDIVGGAWPTQVANVPASLGAGNLGAGCVGGSIVAGPGNKGFTLSGASIAASATCDITFAVTSSTVGVWHNDIPNGAVTSTQNFYSPAASATLDVRDTSLAVSKSVSPTSVSAGDIVTFTVNIESFSTSPQSNVTFIDTLPGGMLLVDGSVTNGINPVLSGAGCTGLAQAGSAAAPQFTLNIPAADADGLTCTVKFTARVPASATPGVTTFINSLPVGSVGNGGVSNTAAAAAGTLSVLQPLTVSKTFDGVTNQALSQGSPSVLEIILTNNNYSALTGVAFTDTLPTAPGQIRVANPPNATSTCGGTLTANAGDTAIVLAGGNIGGRSAAGPSFAPGTCSIRVSVVGGAVGTHTNTIPVGAITAQGTIAGTAGVAVANTNQAQATLKYDAALTVAKSFLTDPVTSGGSSRVRIVLGNTGNGVLNNVAVTDPLPAGLLVATPPNASSTCAGPIAITAAAGANSAQLTGASVPSGANCEFLFDVVTSTGVDSINTIPIGGATADGGVASTNAASATLHKSISGLVLSKAFNPTTLSSPGQPSVMTITITNNGGVGLTNLGIIDNMPAGMQVAAVPNASTTCPGGIVGGAAAATSVALSNGTLAGGGASCTVQIEVTSLVVGTLTNTLPAGIVTDNQGVSNAAPFSANLSALAALGVQKSFNPPSVPPNTRSRLTVQVNNSLVIPLTGVSGTDNLPAGLTVAVPPNTSTTCTGATVSTTATAVSFIGASVAAGANCQVQVDVIATAVGAYDNFIPGGSLVANGGTVTNPNPGVHAILNVLTPPTISKAFTAAVVNPGQPNRLTVTINNPNATRPLTNLSLKDTLPAGLFVAPVPNASTTCAGGSVSAISSATSAQMAGATIAAGASCTFQFDTISNVAGLYTNTIPAGSITTSEGVTNPDPAIAQVQVLTPPGVTKSFSPPSITSGGTSRLTITLSNPTSSAQTLTADLNDTLPTNVTVAGAPAIGGSCTTASISIQSASTVVRYANGASIPAGGCTIQVNVTGTVAGTYNNTIPAGALHTNVGVNPDPAVAPLVISDLGAISGLVYRDDNNNGLHATAEPPIAGVTVTLSGPVSLTTTTDAAGNYLFSGLPAGVYTVTETQPAAYLNGKTTAGTITGAGGGTAGTASGPGVAPSAISTITLGSSGGPTPVIGSSIDNNFGELVGSDISGFVYRDDDNNGIKGGSEPALAGVAIALTGNDDLGNAVNLTTNTAADGSYSFNGLRPSGAGGYLITEGAQPAGTDNGMITPGTVVDKTLNTNTGTPGTRVIAPGVGTSAITGLGLPANARSPNNNFGEISNSRTISGRIFTDNNADGAANGADAGVGAGATGANNVAQSLTLTGTDLNGNPVTATTTSDASGNYSFANLPPSNPAGYTITCTTCNPPAGFVNSAGPLAYPGSTGGTAAGTQAAPAITGINLAGASIISVNNNFTKVPPGQQISGRMFFDANNNGLFDTPADIGLSGQTVELRDNTTSALVKTTTTDANGFYAFTGVAPGTYKIVEPTQPAGTADGKTQAGTVNGVATGTATAQNTTPSTITGVLVGAGQSGANYNFPEIATVSLGGRVFADTNLNGNFDGGDVALQGVVMQLTGTDNFGNAVSRFIGTDVNGQYSFTGLLPGTYTVTENQPSGYTSTQNVPGTITNGTAGAISPLGAAQETVTVTLNGPTSSAPNINFLEQTGTAAIRGFKSVINSTRPGQQPAVGETVVWTISYKNESATTQPLQIADALPAGLSRIGAPALTVSSSGVVTGLAVNGAYAGTGNLLAGGVTFGAGAVVTVNVPAVVQPGASGILKNQGNPPGSAVAVPTNQVDNTTPGLPAGVVVPPNSLPQPSPTNANANNGVPTQIQIGSNPNTTAAVSGTVWLDNNSNRSRDGGDQLLGGWGVAIYNSAGQLVPCVKSGGTGIPNTTTDCVVLPNGQSLFKTDASGNYGANGLVPGNYTIKFYDATNTTNPTIVYGTPLNGANNPNSRVATTRDALNITLAPGQNIPEQDLPLDPSGVVYDSGSRSPIPGSTVQLCGPAGFNPAVMLVGGGGYTVTGNCASMVTGATGLYQFLLTSTAPAGTYTLNATAAGHLPTASTAIPPSPGPHTPAGPSPVRIQAQAGPPTGGAPTTYYLAFNLAPGMPDVIHNHIPLDPSGGGALFLQKAVDRDTVELGDSLQYTLRISAPNGGATNGHITDHLPAGFRLIPGTVIINSTKAPDPVGAPGPNLDFNVGSLTVAGTITTVTYRVRVGVGAQQGDGINRASATATIGGVTVRSNNAQARVKITSGVFFQEACVVGKIFIDCNNNGIQDREELGIPGVRFYLQDGTYLISDVEGKYSYCGLPARTAVMKVDGSTLPLGSQLVTSSNRNALDPNSLFLDLQMGELHRADFIEGSCGPGIVEQTKARQSKGMVVSPIPEKKPQPKLIFESGSIRDSVPGERDDIMRSCSGGQCTAPASGVTGGAK